MRLYSLAISVLELVQHSRQELRSPEGKNTMADGETESRSGGMEHCSMALDCERMWGARRGIRIQSPHMSVIFTAIEAS